MNLAVLKDKFQTRTSLGIWIPVILAEICLGAAASIFPPKPLLVGVMCIPLLIYLFMKPFHAYLLTILLLPFWEVTLSGVGGVEGQMDIRYTQIAAAIAIMSWFVSGLVSKKLTFENHTLYIPIALLIGWMFLSLAWAVNMYAGMREFLQILFGATVFFLTVNIVRDKKHLDLTMKIWIVAGLLCAFVGVIELFTTTLSAVKKLPTGTIEHWGAPVRVSGLRESPHRFGFFLNLTLMITVSQLIVAKSRKYKAFLVFCIFSILMVLMSTMSRSTWVGCFVDVACFSMFSKRSAKIFFISCIIAVVLLMTVAPGSLRHAIVERFKGVVNPTQTKSIAGRASVWGAGMKMFQENPFTGVGIGSFSALSKELGSIKLEAPHNIYVFFLSQFGLIGLSSFLFLIACIFSSMIRGFRHVRHSINRFILLGIFVGFVIYFTQGIVVSFKFIEMEIWALLGLAAAAVDVFTLHAEEGEAELSLANKPITG